ncbi:MAG: heavy metal translocating P-type ATPase [Burkholderiaceae bacterium]
MQTDKPPSLRCFHCGEPVPNNTHWTTRIDGTDQPMCCLGCQAVAQAIVDVGAQVYYKQRTVMGVDQQMLDQLSPWASLIEDPAWAARHVQTSATAGPNDKISTTTLAIEGLRCGACAWLIEKILVAQPGVLSAAANATSARLTLRWRPELTNLKTLGQTLLRYGYAMLPIGSTALEQQRQAQTRTSNRRLFVAGLAAAQVMMLATPEYTAFDDLEPSTIVMLRLAALVITLPTLIYAGAPFFLSALRAIRLRQVNMDVPISIGLLLAFLGSLAASWMQARHVYFDSVCMFLFFVLGARSIEQIITKRALAKRERMALQTPLLANRLSPAPGQVPAWQLQPGDVIEVASGQAFAADAELVDHATELDLSSLTGELTPVSLAVGQRCPEGAINLGVNVRARVLTDAAAGSLARLSQLAEQAAAQRPQWTQWADRVAAHFTVGLLSLAAVVLGLHLWLGHPVEVWLPTLVAVLVVSCPCALSVAGPAAYAAALAGLLERGIVLANPTVIQTSWRLTDVVFDKTGTLTQPADAQIVSSSQEHWPLLAALTRHNHHPLAQAIYRQAMRSQPAGQTEPPLTQVQAMAGLGIQATLGDQQIRLGSASFVTSGAQPTGQSSLDHKASVFLAIDGQLLASLAFEDSPRDDSQAVLSELRGQGLQTWLMSGDTADRVGRLGEQLGFSPNHVLAACSPNDKQARLKALQAKGRVLAMVGDGINDAPVLAQADLSIAVAGSAPLALQRADCYLLAPKLSGVSSLLRVAQRTRVILRQNITWAIGYNLLAIPAAALGYLPPVWAALGMASSSLIVMLNAARLLPKHPS